jgi:hypothetical protein
MNRTNKLFFNVYPGLLSAPTSVQYYDLSTIDQTAPAAESEVGAKTREKNTSNDWAQAVIRLTLKPWWRKAERPNVAA